jgi:hypothetical protein
MLKYGQFKFFNLEISVLNEIEEFDFFDCSLESISEKLLNFFMIIFYIDILLFYIDNFE